MRFRVPDPRRVAESLRDFARRRPVEAAEYIEQHRDEWEALVEDSPETAADVLEAIDGQTIDGLDAAGAAYLSAAGADAITVRVQREKTWIDFTYRFE